MAQQRITRDDLESKFREAQGGLQGKLNDKKQTLVADSGKSAELLKLFKMEDLEDLLIKPDRFVHRLFRELLQGFAIFGDHSPADLKLLRLLRR